MKPKTMTVYLGWDPREEAAYAVARFSIARRTTEPIKIIPLKLKHLDMLKRPIEKRVVDVYEEGVPCRREWQMWCPISEAPMSTEFAISRFCVPFLQEEGWAVFADCDILCWSDIRELFDLADEQYAVQVVKHKHEWAAGTPETSLKMDNQIQTFYSRKNWSSVVLWNCDHPANKKFHVEHLNTWPGRDLHAFKWLEDSEIGELPQHWNWLIKVTQGEPEKKGIWHYTLGGPWFEDYFDDYAQEWCDEAERLKHGLGVPVLS